MATRRNVMLGMGGLAVGSGIISVQAAFSDSVDPGTDFQVVAAGDLEVRRGNAFDDSTPPSWVKESELDFEDAEQKAYADEDVNGNLSVELAVPNDADTYEFDELLEIENLGTTTETVGINYDGGYAFSGSEDWAVDDYSTDTENITKRDVQEIFQFFDDEDLISPDPTSGDDEEPANFVELEPGDGPIQIDLTVTLTETQVDIFAEHASADQPFSSGPDGDSFQLLNQATVGTGPWDP